MLSNKKRRTIFVKMALTNVVILLLSLFFVGYISHKKSKNAMENNLEITSLQILKQANKGFSEYLNKMTQELTILNKNVDIKDLEDPAQDYKKTQQYVQYALKSIKESLSGIDNVYYSAEHGAVIVDSEITDETKLSFRDKYWYKKAKENTDKFIYSEPYVDAVTGNNVLTISKAVTGYNGEFIGVVGIDINLSEIETYIHDVSLLDYGYIVIADNNGKIVINNEKNKTFGESLSGFEFWDTLKNSNQENTKWTNNGELTFVLQTIDEKTGWRIVGFVEEKEITEHLSSIKNTIFIAVAVFFTLGIIASLILTKTITEQIKKINIGVRKIATGNLRERIKVSSKDEIQELAENLNTALDSISGLLKEIDSTSEEMYDSASGIASMSEETNAAVSEVANAINEVSNGATDQATAISNVTNTVDGLSNRIDDVDKNINNILNLSEVTDKLSDDGLKVLNLLIEKSVVTKQNTQESSSNVKEMTDSIKNINQISDVISGITEQTNLLALNASIEAARAGELGKGFAVVAEEIRKLAEESKDSTDKIKSIIKEVNQKSIRFVDSMEETVNILNEQDESINNTKNIFIEIAESIEPLVEAIRYISNLTDKMNNDKENVKKEIDNISVISQDVASVSEEVTASAEEVTATMDELTEYADKLDGIAENLKEKLNKFEL
ncbi:methyl-accepting chemotaxis protein [Clostridium butyricum]|uniref:Methyl-accepting chemotaxis sensory transducer n=1 Tax=Clostridium butyricum E4 str. BoNT E BL5262 TaxID=632245 RepID=C4IM81_CLOBU|nr:methyl-accepting chemotaxis protein [Clostridium butyricum]APF24674.1 methyl-accepting chemotaxis (MCP) signaling domain protein [Clostridium butyricum]EDT74613.1 putative methyl-accepting chemotaxis protein, contain hamp domain [Clostridium butyricum 5521]EEP52831.1 methyl-accepting chemotaxis sensory transducer [Clostridium butyricum E4 str. BoNT E BL5262]NFL32223.1 methyl-accepting chemotaxis protein [Clostridium butyricum]NFS19078.1 methyl-accepting chemotaxis protein [Clostridium butyr